MSDRDERPSLGVVLAGGFGVLAIVGFVVVLVFGATSEVRGGDRVEVVRGQDGPVVLAGRCSDQRVVSVSLSAGNGTLWRITSAKGSIQRRYPVGATPFDFTVDTPLTTAPTGAVRVEVGFEQEGDRTTDARTVDVGSLPTASPRLDAAAPPCGSRRLRPGALTALLFAGGALAVVVGYGAMVLRFVGK